MKKNLLVYLGLLLAVLLPTTAEATTYTIAGNNAKLWGQTWTPSATANDMTRQSDGTYKWTSATITAEQNLSLAFKVCEDHAWDVSYGNNGKDYTYTLKAGSGKVSITFNPSSKAIGVDVSEWTESSEVKPVTYNVYLGTYKNKTLGITTQWGQGEDTKFTASDDNKTFTKTIKNPGAAMEFKIITNDGANTGWYGTNDFSVGNDYTLSTTASGNITLPLDAGYDSYTMTVTRNDDGSEWKLKVVGNGTSTNISKVYVASNASNWKCVEEYMFTPNADGTEYNYSLNIPSTDFQFKIVIDGKTWLSVGSKATTLAYGTEYTLGKYDGLDNNLSLPTNTTSPLGAAILTVTRKDNAWTLTVIQDNAQKVSIDEGSDSRNLTPGLSDVTLTRTFNDNAWNTLVLPFDVADNLVYTVFGSDVKLAEYTGATKNADGKYTLNFTTVQSITANKPVLVYGATATTSAYIFKGVTIKTADPTQTADGFSFCGSYSVKTAQAGDWFIGEDNKLYKATGTEKLKATRAVFHPETATAQSAKALSLGFGGTTGVSSVKVDGQDITAPAYNLAGQRVSGSYKGIVIRGGKKYINIK